MYHMNMDHVKVQESMSNTPFGIFFASQAQGKIFQYRPGGGLTPISDQGMKWWMNKIFTI